MKYEVKEKKFYEVLGIKEILKTNAILKHIETTFDLEKYLLEVEIFYMDSNDSEQNINFGLPVDFATTMTEQLIAKLDSFEAELEEGKGVNLMFNLVI